MTRQSSGHLFIISGVFCVGVIAALTKKALLDLTPIWFVTWLYALSVPLSFPFGQKLFLPRKGKDALFFTIHVLGIALGWFCAANGLKVLDAATATFIGRVEFPILMIISMFFLKEKLGKLIWPCIALSLAGITMLTEKGVIHDLLKLEEGRNLAVFMMVLGAIGFACGEMGTKVLARKYKARAFTFMRNILLLPLLLVVAFAVDGWKEPTAISLFYTGLCGLAGPVLARIFYMEGLKRIPLGHATVLTQLEPVMTLAFVFILGMELPDKKEYLGCFLIFSSSMLLVTGHWIGNRQKMQ
ncbi:MAG: DMT family transporter [Deltaproteobacteria bacterium]|nr:MAG: DMT family transporter [Deltaproteobacteria bacterium]